jgi:hypothetical protein
MRLGYEAGLIIVGCVLALMIQEAFAKTYDEKKWEAFNQNRAERRAIERRYESCVRQCRETCK